MTIDDLQVISDNYIEHSIGLSDKLSIKETLDGIIDCLRTISNRVDTLEEQMANRMLCTKYKDN